MSTVLDDPRPTYATRGGAALAPAAPLPGRRPAPSSPPTRDPRHLRVVAPGERARRRLTPKLGVVLTGLVFVMLFAIATAHTLLVQNQIRLDDLDAQLSTEQARYQELRKEVAEMESPARIVSAAEELGMVAPDDLVYLQPGADPQVVARPSTLGAGAASTAEADQPDVPLLDSGSWAAMKPLLEAAAP
jgi:cell division protein FtsL